MGALVRDLGIGGGGGVRMLWFAMLETSGRVLRVAAPRSSRNEGKQLSIGKGVVKMEEEDEALVDEEDAGFGNRRWWAAGSQGVNTREVGVNEGFGGEPSCLELSV